MSRTPNDNRSDSLNPNNSAYEASEANREEQLGLCDDDDYLTGSSQEAAVQYHHAEPEIEPLKSSGTKITLDFPAPPRPNYRNMFYRLG